MTRATRAAFALVLVALLGRGHAEPAGENPAAAGKRVFHACQACHALDARGTTDSGPTLYGLFGRKAGTAEHFDYSDAMRNAAIVWSGVTLDAFLRNPQAYIPANAMAYGGVGNAAERTLLIAYLKSVTTPATPVTEHPER